MTEDSGEHILAATVVSLLISVTVVGIVALVLFAIDKTFS